jgi:hypothetical protein
VRFEKFEFGLLRIDGVDYQQDVVIDRGQIKTRKKKPSRRFREEYGHTPLSVEERIPWNCRRLVVGTGADGALPIMPQVRGEAEDRGIELVALPTAQAIKLLGRGRGGDNAVLHITC